MILCAGRSESFDFARSIGVGLIESSMKLTQIVLEEKPSFLCFIGTAGSYGNHKIFDLLHSHQASNVELGFLNNLCYTPLENHIETTEYYVSRGTKIPSVIVNSSNYITSDSALANKMLSHNLELENMEFFSVLSVAKHFNLLCSGFFVVTNYCNQNAHRDFIKNHNKAKELLSLHIINTLKI